MDLLLVALLSGTVAGSLLSWLILGLLYRWRERRVGKEAAQAALKRSRRVLKGQAAEQLAPLTEEFQYLANDARFLGSPVDYLVFDGLSESGEVEVVFLEIKSGQSRLSEREARVREAVDAGRVRWEELRF